MLACHRACHRLVHPLEVGCCWLQVHACMRTSMSVSPRAGGAGRLIISGKMHSLRTSHHWMELAVAIVTHSVQHDFCD